MTQEEVTNLYDRSCLTRSASGVAYRSPLCSINYFDWINLEQRVGRAREHSQIYWVTVNKTVLKWPVKTYETCGIFGQDPTKVQTRERFNCISVILRLQRGWIASQVKGRCTFITNRGNYLTCCLRFMYITFVTVNFFVCSADTVKAVKFLTLGTDGHVLRTVLFSLLGHVRLEGRAEVEMILWSWNLKTQKVCLCGSKNDKSSTMKSNYVYNFSVN